MEKVQLAKLNMYQSVQHMLNTHESAWNGIPAFVEAKTVYDEKLSHLVLNGPKQKVINKGISTKKRELINQGITFGLVVSSALKSLAAATNDQPLLEKALWTKTSLGRGKQADVLGRLKELHSLAVEHQSALLNHGLAPEIIQGLIDTVNAAEAMVSLPRMAEIGRKHITREIAVLIDELDDVLDLRIDPLVNVLSLEHPAFAQQYKDARIIVDYGSRKSTEKGDTENPEADDGQQPQDGPPTNNETGNSEDGH